MADSTDLIQQIIKTSEFEPGRLCLQSAGLAFVQRSEKIDETGSDLDSGSRDARVAPVRLLQSLSVCLMRGNATMIVSRAI